MKTKLLVLLLLMANILLAQNVDENLYNGPMYENLSLNCRISHSCYEIEENFSDFSCLVDGYIDKKWSTYIPGESSVTHEFIIELDTLSTINHICLNHTSFNSEPKQEPEEAFRSAVFILVGIRYSESDPWEYFNIDDYCIYTDEFSDYNLGLTLPHPIDAKSVCLQFTITPQTDIAFSMKEVDIRGTSKKKTKKFQQVHTIKDIPINNNSNDLKVFDLGDTYILGSIVQNIDYSVGRSLDAFVRYNIYVGKDSPDKSDLRLIVSDTYGRLSQEENIIDNVCPIEARYIGFEFKEMNERTNMALEDIEIWGYPAEKKAELSQDSPAGINSIYIILAGLLVIAGVTFVILRKNGYKLF